MKEIKVQLSNGSSFYILSDIGDYLEAAVINWEARTSKFTAESLCDYINSKGLHKAYFEIPKGGVSKITIMTVADVIKSGVNTKLPMSFTIGVLLAAVNDNSENTFTGVWQENGELLGSPTNALQWGDFLLKPVKVGNIEI